jgi:heme exporter protein C
MRGLTPRGAPLVVKGGGFDLFQLVAFALVTAVYVLAFGFTPPDVNQGEVQKILYVHAPAAWVAMLAFTTVGVAGILYLWLRDDRLDRFGAASVEVGLVFILVVLITGPIWGKPVWGVYWNWGDARLTSTLVLALVYLGYLVMRGGIDDRDTRSRYSAIIGILGALLVPFVHLSVYLFDSAHPNPMIATPDVLSPDSRNIPDSMLRTLLLSFAAFSLLYVAFVRSRYRLQLQRDALRVQAAARARAGI